MATLLCAFCAREGRETQARTVIGTEPMCEAHLAATGFLKPAPWRHGDNGPHCAAMADAGCSLFTERCGAVVLISEENEHVEGVRFCPFCGAAIASPPAPPTPPPAH